MEAVDGRGGSEEGVVMVWVGRRGYCGKGLGMVVVQWLIYFVIRGGGKMYMIGLKTLELGRVARLVEVH